LVEVPRKMSLSHQSYNTALAYNLLILQDFTSKSFPCNILQTTLDSLLFVFNILRTPLGEG
jgi:hypothetical protein